MGMTLPDEVCSTFDTTSVEVSQQVVQDIWQQGLPSGLSEVTDQVRDGCSQLVLDPRRVPVPLSPSVSSDLPSSQLRSMGAYFKNLPVPISSLSNVNQQRVTQRHRRRREKRTPLRVKGYVEQRLKG